MNTFQFEKEMGDNDVFDKFKDWISTPELRKLIFSFGGDFRSTGTLVKQINELLIFSDAWDFRNKQKNLIHIKRSGKK